MAYADKGAGSNKLVSVLLVVLLHVALGFGLIIGLNYEAIKKELGKTQVIEIKEEEKKEEPPPPPPDQPTPPPAAKVFAQESPVPRPAQMQTTPIKQDAPIVTCGAGEALVNGVCQKVNPNEGKEYCGTTNSYVAPGSCPKPQVECDDGTTAPTKAQCTKVCNGSRIPEGRDCEAPKPKAPPTKVKPKGAPGNWVPKSVYPRNALREKREGRTGFTLTVGPNGRPTACSVTSSSGHADLDAAVCPSLMKRAKFDPATVDGQPVSTTYSNAVTWRIDG